MATPNSSRGIPYQFNGDQFRNAIQFVFEMAAPPISADQLTFHFTETVTYTGRADGDKVPFDPGETVVRQSRQPVQVPCDVEYVNASEDPTSFGLVVPTRLKILLLDEDYEKVKDSSFVVMGGDRYNRLYEPPSFGLFDVGLHTLVFQAENEV